MDNPWYVISDLENHASRINKEQIIEAQANFGNHEFFHGCRLAMDSMITFGLKQIPEKTDEDGSGLDWNSFTFALTNFTNRTVTGNAARDTVAALMAKATKAQWNGWYRRILIKDLRCGVSEKTINKVVEKQYPNYSIPVFSTQLAQDGADHSAKLTGKKFIQSKLDGVRVITIVYPNGRVDQYSRNGKELLNFTHIKEEFATWQTTMKVLKEPMVYDGEVVSSSFQDLMKQVHRKSDVQSADAKLYLFDMLPLAEFEAGRSEWYQGARIDQLENWYDFNNNFFKNVEVLGSEIVNLDTKLGKARFNEINKQAIEQGFEGIMIKDPTAYYECKRTASWLKLKPVITVDLQVTAIEEGTGKNLGRLGALVCNGVENNKSITVNVGSGFTDDLRTEIWSNKEAIVGQTVEVKADAITQNQDGSYSLRFPRFERFRDDK